MAPKAATAPCAPPGGLALTAFEKARIENIRRNNEVMEQMGIPGLVPDELRLRRSSGRAAGSSSRKRSRAPDAADATDRRRSSRLANVPAPVYTTFDQDEDLGDVHHSGRGSRTGRHSAVVDDPQTGSAPPPAGLAPPLDAAPAAPGSCKGMRAQVAAMQAAWLGKLVTPEDGSGAMKATAMARLRGSSQAPRFNKYSGIQEWANAVALFVNVRGKAGGLYPNVFLDGGRKMTWFGQPTQSEETPVIQRLLACTSADAATPVVLFCREEGCAYVYAGQLRCDAYFPKASPLKLVWELLDFDALVKQPDFAALLGA